MTIVGAYSSRKARIGLTRDARRAGANAASTVISSSGRPDPCVANDAAERRRGRLDYLVEIVGIAKTALLQPRRKATTDLFANISLSYPESSIELPRRKEWAAV